MGDRSSKPPPPVPALPSSELPSPGPQRRGNRALAPQGGGEAWRRCCRVEEEGSGARGGRGWAEVMETPRRPRDLVARAPGAAGRTCHWRPPGAVSGAGGGAEPAASRGGAGRAGARAPSAPCSLRQQPLCPPGARAARGRSPGTFGGRPPAECPEASRIRGGPAGGGGAAVSPAAPGETPPFPLADGQVAGERGLSASKALASAHMEIEEASPYLLSLHRLQGTKHFSEYPCYPQKNFVAVCAGIPRKSSLSRPPLALRRDLCAPEEV